MQKSLKNTDDKKKKSKSSGNPNDILKYSGMAFQMAAILLAGTLIGQYLDEHFGNERPLFMLGCIIISIFAAFYLTLKDFIIKK